METVVYLSLTEGVRMVEDVPGEVGFESPPTAFRPRLTLRQVTPGLAAAMRRLADEGATAGALTGSAMASDGTGGLAKLFHYLGRLDALALLTRRLTLDGQTLLTHRPISPYSRWNEQAVDGDTPFVLSRFALCRAADGALLVESPRGHAELRVEGRPAVAALGELVRPLTAAELARAIDVDDAAALALLRTMANAAVVVASPERRPAPEDDDPVLAQWSLHDMYFHTRSRLGRHADPYGGTFPFKGRLEAPPVVKPTPPSPAIPLHRPDLETAGAHDMPFTQVLERRASLRAHGAEPITAEQLGEFLFRSARVKRASSKSAVSFRPAPSAGALHPLEVYPLIGACKGIEPGLYHYDPKEHALHIVAEPDEAVRTLLHLGGVTAMMPSAPQVLLIITARFQRVQNKYQSVAYAAILKDVGCLYQTMYLVATAMGLAPCALGGGHSDLFAHAAGLDYFTETSVGEFVLGTIGPGAWDAAGGEQWHMAHPAPAEGERS